MSTDIFYIKAYGYITVQLTGKLLFSFSFISSCLKSLRINGLTVHKTLLTTLHCLALATALTFLLILAGDVHLNPGPINSRSEHCITVYIVIFEV